MSCWNGDPYYVDCVPACTKPYPCPQAPCCGPVVVTGPTGPPSAFAPSSFFQVALAETVEFSLPTLIPYSIVTTGNLDLSFDTTTGEFVAPTLGYYQFSFSATVSEPLGGVTDSVSFTVDGSILSTVSVFFASDGLQTLSGSTILQLLPGQRVGLTASTNDGGGPPTVTGPSTIGAPPYPTIFSGFSLF